MAKRKHNLYPNPCTRKMMTPPPPSRFPKPSCDYLPDDFGDTISVDEIKRLAQERNDE